jgi:peptidyl-prolyl cis-trans isomerase SurA
VQVVTEILPPRPKELNEARGYVIADYQDELERRWVEELRRAYEVEVNERVLKKLIAS